MLHAHVPCIPQPYTEAHRSTIMCSSLSFSENDKRRRAGLGYVMGLAFSVVTLSSGSDALLPILSAVRGGLTDTQIPAGQDLHFCLDARTSSPSNQLNPTNH